MKRHLVIVLGAAFLCAALLAGCAKGTPPAGAVPAFCAHGASYYDKVYHWNGDYYSAVDANRHGYFVPIEYTCRLCAEVYKTNEEFEREAHIPSTDGSRCTVCDYRF